jgi:hypothetical protein
MEQVPGQSFRPTRLYVRTGGSVSFCVVPRARSPCFKRALPPCTHVQLEVGFRFGKVRDGTIVLASPEGCPNVSAPMVALTRKFKSFLETSTLPCLDRMASTGGGPRDTPLCCLL